MCKKAHFCLNGLGMDEVSEREEMQDSSSRLENTERQPGVMRLITHWSVIQIALDQQVRTSRRRALGLEPRIRQKPFLMSPVVAFAETGSWEEGRTPRNILICARKFREF